MTPAVKSKNPFLAHFASGKIKWNLWGESVLKRSAEIDKPLCIFVHNNENRWSHAMRDNLKNDEIVKLLNEDFVPVLADCYDEPQLTLAARAMSHIMLGHAGWPLILFLTPDKRPIFASAYLPMQCEDPKTPGLLEVLRRIKWLWLMKKSQIEAASNSFCVQLRKALLPYKGKLNAGLAARTSSTLCVEADFENGGFGKAPKFPYPGKLLLCLSLVENGLDDGRIEPFIKKSLDAYFYSALYDHIGGGFFDYCKDVKLHQPYLGKHLALNAGMLSLYGRAYEHFKEPLYKFVFEDTLHAMHTYRRDDGLFLSGDDVHEEEAVENYYLCSNRNILSIPESDAQKFFNSFEIVVGGNYSNPMTGNPTKKHILYFPSEDKGKNWKDVQDICSKLHQTRLKKERPPVENCVRVSENAYLAGVLARESKVMDEVGYLETALEIVNRLLRLENAKGFCHSVYGSELDGKATIEDMAALAFACTEIYAVMKEKRWLDCAIEQCRKAQKLFGESGAMRAVSEGVLDIVPAYEDADYILSSGNGLFANVFTSIFELTGERTWLDKASSIINAFGGSLNEFSTTCSALTAAALRVDKFK